MSSFEVHERTCVRVSMRSHASAWWSASGNGEGSRLMRPLCSVAGVVVVVALGPLLFVGARPCWRSVLARVSYAILCSLVWSEIGIGGRSGWVEFL
jgi:hypothetical protein